MSTRYPKLRRAAVACTTGMAVAWLAWRVFRWSLGSPADLMGDTWHVGVRVLDSTGDLLYFAPSSAGLRGAPVSLDEVGERLVIATLYAEDRRFRDHDGVDRIALVRATLQNVRAGRIVSGASTITQQLVELLETRGAARADTVADKLAELAEAQNLEAELAKDDILIAYLNRAPYGNGLVGVKAAANSYFGKRPAHLSWAHAAFLAVIPRAPSALDPRRFPDRVKARQRRLLTSLHAAGELSDREFETAMHETIEVDPRPPPFRVPHLVLSLAEAGAATEVRTTLKPKLQTGAERVVALHTTRLASMGAHNAAALVVDNTDGHVLAYVGNLDWSDDHSTRVDMVRARRQAGSILKPFAFALAYDKGLHASDIVPDIPIEIATETGLYSPDNIDGAFLGPLSAAEALSLSRNVPAVWVEEFVGENELLELLRALGFAGLSESVDFYGPTLVLGSGQVSVWETAAAYSCLARAGDCIPLAVTGADAGSEPVRSAVLSAAATSLVLENLSNAAWRARFLEIGMAPTQFQHPVATKTGTSQNHVDTWAVAVSHKHTIAVWAGNTDGSVTRGLTGATGAGPLAIDLMRLAWAKDGGSIDQVWDADAIARATVCPLSGGLPTEHCPDQTERLFAPEHLPTEPCSLHQVGELRGDGNFQCRRLGKQRAVLLDDEYAPWLSVVRGRTEYRGPYGDLWLTRSETVGCPARSGSSE